MRSSGSVVGRGNMRCCAAEKWPQWFPSAFSRWWMESSQYGM